MKKATRFGDARAVRMNDVAQRANVSPMTVSRALSNPEMVSEKTRDKILAAIEQTGYVPNRIAGSLASNRSNTVGLILPSIKNSLFSETIQAAADVLSKKGYLLLIADSGHLVEEEEKLVEAFLGQRVSGMILHNTEHTERTMAMISNSGIPVVESGDLTSHPMDISVSYSNFEASKAMTRYLLDKGYRRIGFVSLLSKNNNRACLRRDGYLSALEEVGVKVDEALMIEAGSSLEAGRGALTKFVQLAEKPDAIFFAGDIMAAGAAFECQKLNIRIPDDIAIASFDDLDILQHMSPSITSLQIPRIEIGHEAASIILSRIEGQETSAVTKDLGFNIVERQST